MPGCDCPPYDCAMRVSRCQAGDGNACGEVIQKMVPRIEATARKKLVRRDSDAWEDVRQAVSMLVLQKLPQWHQRGKFCDWVGAIAGNCAISFLRAKRPQPWPEHYEPQESNPGVMDLSTRECIDTTLAGFPKEWVAIYDLTVQGESREATAKTLKISVRKVHYCLEAIRNQLRSCL